MRFTTPSLPYASAYDGSACPGTRYRNGANPRVSRLEKLGIALLAGGFSVAAGVNTHGAVRRLPGRMLPQPIEDVMPFFRHLNRPGTHGDVLILEPSHVMASHAKATANAVESAGLGVGVAFDSIHSVNFRVLVNPEDAVHEVLQAQESVVHGLESVNVHTLKPNAVNLSLSSNWVQPQLNSIHNLSRNITQAVQHDTVNELQKRYPAYLKQGAKHQGYTVNHPALRQAYQRAIDEASPTIRQFETRLEQQVRRLRKHNIPVFVASGNAGGLSETLQGHTPRMPVKRHELHNAFSVPGTISVGAANPDGSLASYSSHFEGIRYTAPMPGVNTTPSKASLVEGTSFATPQVAAAGAYLIHEKNYTIGEMLAYLDTIGTPRVYTQQGIAHPYTYLPFDAPMLKALKDAPEAMGPLP